MKINQVQERIQELFGIFVAEMKAAKALNRTGINHVYERILIPLLSLCYGFENLKNLNSAEYFNYPGVDLGDSVARVAIQVTTTRNSKRVKQALTKFREKELFKQYDRLIIYILSEKQSSYSGKGFDEISQGQFEFDKDRDIIDFSDLLKIIKDFQIDKAKGVLQILEANIAGTELRTPTISQHEYEDVGGYLERTVCETKDAGPYSAFLLREDQMFDLTTIVQREKSVVLLCDAGVGKTTELKRIAAVYSKPDSPFHIDLISLNKYVNHSIEQMLCPEWSNQLGNHSLVILDGFDEIESQNRNNAVRQIELFVERHPTVNVVVSCRTNFYNRESEGFSGTLRHFSSYTLLPLTDAAISQYIGTRLGTRGRLFMQRISSGQLHDLLYSPFYLTRLVELFLQTGDLPQQKADIFEQLIKHSLTLDTEKFRATESLINKQAEIIETIERLALSMEMLGRNFLKDNEYREIIRESATRQLAQYCALWKKEEKVSWQFDQNSFQEYLAARVLARHPLPTIKNFVSFEPEYPKVIPSWTNTLSFLVSILKPGDPKLTALIEWLQEIEPEVIIKFESDKIPEAVRVSYLKSIIEDHKRKEIVFDYEKFSYHELARFGQSDEAIRYLIEEANSSANVAMLVNILNLLRFMSLPHSQRQAAGSLFETLVTNRELDGHVRYLASVALADHGFTSGEVINRVVAANRDSNDDEVKHGLFYLLVNSKYLEDNIDVLLDGIQYANGMGGTVGHSTILVQGLESVRTLEAMKLIFAHMKAHPNLWSRSFLDDHIPIIINNAAALHSSDHTIRADVLEIVFIWTRNYHRQQAEMVAAFFDITGTRFETFLAVYEGRGHFPNQHHDWFELLALLAHEQGLQFFAAEYAAGRLTEQDVWGFQNALGFVRGAELYAVFNSLINAVSGNQFVLPPARNYEAEQREMSQRNFNLLFDRDAFLSAVNQIFAEELATELTTQQIEKIFSDGLQDGHKYSTLAVQELREIAISSRGTVSQQLVLECVNNAWERVSIDKIYRYLEHDDKIELTAEQHTKIAAWCNANLRNVDFRSAIVVNPDGSWNTNAIGTKLWFFQRRLGLDYPEGLMLDMLSYEIFDQSGLSGIEYFEDRVDSVLMTGRVLDNLAAGIRSPYVLKNHLNYCKRHKVQEVIPHALREIVTPLSDSFGRHDALETVISFPNAVENLEKVLPQINDGFKWSVIEYLNNHDSVVALGALRTILAGENDSDRLRAAIALIERNSLDGLAYYVDHVERTKQYPAGPMEKSPLRNLQSSEAVPFVMRLLKVSLDPDIIGKDQFSFLYNAALSALNKIALSSRDSFLLVRGTFTAFMRENHDINGIRNLHFQLSRLERTYFTSVAQRLTLREVSTRLDAIFDPSNRAQRSRA